MPVIGDGGAGTGDRRLRPHSHNPPAVKCPRCDSLNTKFCYYNNYNLSQPRHFCKSCRRYWTKGGVLRNVPVGGGCRKNKRSKSRSCVTADSTGENKTRNKSSTNESSDLTAVASAAVAVTASAEEGSAPNPSLVRDFPDATVFDVNPETNQSFDNPPSAGGRIFPAEIGSFTGMLDSSEEVMGFGSGDIPLTTTSFGHVNQAAMVEKNPAQTTVGSTTADEFKVEENDEELAAALVWGDGGANDQGQFDLTAGIDTSYWSQHQWTVNDQSLHYFP